MEVNLSKVVVRLISYSLAILVGLPALQYINDMNIIIEYVYKHY